MRCDLHTHSIFSDGTCTPAEIISEAKRLGLTVALTDHNTVAGLPDFLEAAEKEGVTAVPGIEFSTAYGSKELHLLGLFIAPEYFTRIERMAKSFHVQKEISNMEMVERLNAAGYMIDYVAVKKRNPTGNANRAHVAAELMEKGYVASVNEAFRTLLGDGQGFYVPPIRLQLQEAIETLRQIHALPILAHPLQELTEQELRAMLPEAMETGLLGIETYHSSYDEEAIALAGSIAEEFGLIPSGGSDFHGATKPAVRLGVGTGNLDIPHSVYERLAALHRSLL